jgi:hypothetical protein
MTMNYKSWNRTGIIATLVIVLSIPLSLVLNRKAGNSKIQAAYFTGGRSCIECHQKEFRLWSGSDHDKAMSVATDSTVLGNFNDAGFTYNGKTSKFYKRDGKFFVFTEGPGGADERVQGCLYTSVSVLCSNIFCLLIMANTSASPSPGIRLKRNGSTWQEWYISLRI